MRTEALERAVRRSEHRRSRRAERCALCAEELPEIHRHLLEMATGHPRCVCQACGLLFERPAASEGRYRTIPDRRVPVGGLDPGDLRVPVGLAFFVVGDDGRVAAHYPSPAGATQWEVDREDWREAVSGSSAPDGPRPRVEALLVNTVGGRSEAWIVPVSDCYRLVGIVRQAWEGLSGGTRVWAAVEEFFEQLRRSDGQDPRG